MIFGTLADFQITVSQKPFCYIGIFLLFPLTLMKVKKLWLKYFIDISMKYFTLVLSKKKHLVVNKNQVLFYNQRKAAKRQVIDKLSS